MYTMNFRQNKRNKFIIRKKAIVIQIYCRHVFIWHQEFCFLLKSHLHQLSEEVVGLHPAEKSCFLFEKKLFKMFLCFVFGSAFSIFFVFLGFIFG